MLCVYSVVKMIIYSLGDLTTAASMGLVTIKFNNNIFNSLSLLIIKG